MVGKSRGVEYLEPKATRQSSKRVMNKFLAGLLAVVVIALVVIADWKK